MHTIAHDSETLASGQQVITACALIHHDFGGVTKVFLPKRALTKKFLPGVHEIPGGHIDFGEDIVSGLKREIMEEFGVAVRIGDPFYVLDYLNSIKGSHSVEIVYFATLEADPANITIHPEDHASANWFSRENLEQAYTGDKGLDDPEFVAVRRGFELLSGATIDTAS